MKYAINLCSISGSVASMGSVRSVCLPLAESKPIGQTFHRVIVARLDDAVE